MSVAESVIEAHPDLQGKKTTRDIILDTAERLMAERGIDSVSLNEIVRASGQKNASALQYHFGDKSGLVQAVYEKHTPGIEKRRSKLMVSFSNTPSLKELIEALVLPLLDEVDNPDGGMDYLLFISRVRYHRFSPQPETDARQSEELTTLSRLISEYMEHLPEEERVLRKLLMRTTLLHFLAEYCLKIKESPDFDRTQRATFKRLLINSMIQVIQQ